MRGVSVAIGLIAGASVVLGSHQASAQFYIGASAGGTQIFDRTQTFNAFEPVTQTPYSNPETISMNTGFTGTASIGYSFRNVRVEIEGGYGHSTYDRINRTVGFPVQPPSSTTPPPPPVFSSTTGFTQISGSVRYYTAAVNVFFQVPTDTFVTPYIGGGVGGAREKSTVLTIASAPFGNSRWTNNFMWQAELGVDFNLGDHFAISPALRYQQIADDPSVYGNTELFIFKVGARLVF